MDETNNVFDISDYGGYFDVSADNHSDSDELLQDIQEPENDITDSELSDIPADSVNEESQEQETQVSPSAESMEPTETPEQYTEVLQDINVHETNIETLSIGILLTLGLILGLIISRIFLDKLWR